MARLMRECVSQESAKNYFAVIRAFDVVPILPEVCTPTLVLHRESIPYPEPEVARHLASAIPDARLMLLAGASLAPYLEDKEEALAAVEEFVLKSGKPGAQPTPPSTIATAPVAGNLTPREVEVLRLIATGRTNAEISRELVLSMRTVARHITNIYGKIGARGKADATAYAIRHGVTTS